MKVNNKVVTYSTGINKNKKLEKRVSPAAYYDHIKALENVTEIDMRVNAKNTEGDKNKIIQKLVESKLGKNNINKMNSLYHTGKELIFKDIMYECFEKALLLDYHFIQENTNNLRAYVFNHIDENGGYKLLENARARYDSEVLNKIHAVCEKLSNKVTKRKMSDEVERSAGFTFDMDDDEKEELKYDKDDINMDELSDLVKQKVLSVVQDEKQRASQRDEFLQDIEDEVAQNSDVTTPDQAQEAMSKMLIKNNKQDTMTLFEALMSKSYKELLEVTLPVDSQARRRKNIVRSYNVNFDMDDAEEDEFKDMNTNETTKLNDPESLTSEDFDDIKLDTECACGESAIDMDVVMAEAITKYTLLEVFNTIKLDVLTYDKVKKLIKNLSK
jgi:hypothetical protein